MATILSRSSTRAAHATIQTTTYSATSSARIISPFLLKRRTPHQSQRYLTIQSSVRPAISLCPRFANQCTSSHQQSPSTLTQLSTSLPQATTQIRGAKRDTYSPSHRIRKRRFGFLARMRSRTGRRVVQRRRAKGRNTLSH